MALFKATITRTERLPDGNILEKGMTLQYSHIGVFPWDGNGPATEAINNAFLRVFGIDLKQILLCILVWCMLKRLGNKIL